jgi:hypothetical protein
MAAAQQRFPALDRPWIHVYGVIAMDGHGVLQYGCKTSAINSLGAESPASSARVG